MPRIPDIDFSAFKDLAAKLQGLSLREEKAALSAAMRAALDPVAKSAKSKLSKGHGLRTGNLKESLGAKVSVYQDGDYYVGLVGPRTGKFKDAAVVPKLEGETKEEYRDRVQAESQPTRYAHLVEYGAMNHRTGRKNRPKPFLRPAWDESQASIDATISKALEAAVKRQFDKLG